MCALILHDRSNQKRIEANLISQSIVTMRRNTEQLCSRKSDESFDSFDNENEFKQRSTITKSSVGGQGIQIHSQFVVIHFNSILHC